MCTSNTFPGSLIPYGLKLQPTPLTNPYPPGLPPGVALELQRSQAAQLYDYGARIRMGLHYAAAVGQPTFGHYGPSPHDQLALMYAKHCDPRVRFLHEEPKPSHSYIGLIAMAILSNKDHKMVLSDIYQYILDNYAYFRTRGPGWRNSIRHNLSLNDCFIKSGRSANGKGHYWAIHPANVEDFKKGDFRRRRAQRKVRKAMGLAVPDDEDSPSPPPQTDPAPSLWASRVMGEEVRPEEGQRISPASTDSKRPLEENALLHSGHPGLEAPKDGPPPSKRRLFDVESLLAPDTDRPKDFGIRAPVPLSYMSRPFPTSLPHPSLMPPPHILQRELIQKNLQLHKVWLSAGPQAFLAARHPERDLPLRASPEREMDLTRPLAVSTTDDSDSENVDIMSPGSPADQIPTSSPTELDRHRDHTPDEHRRESQTLRRETPPADRSPIPIVPSLLGPSKDHLSAFRSTQQHRPIWGGSQLITGIRASSGLLIPTSTT